MVRVVLVDDHDVVRAGLRSLLERQPGLEVVGEAQDGAGAVSLVARLRPDLVMMDIAMPGMNGLDATRQIVAGGGGAKVIAVSMHADQQFVAEVLKAGASGYLLKNSVTQHITQAIRDVMNGRIFLPPDVAGAVAEEYVRQVPAVGAAFHILNLREREVFQMLSQGKTNEEIATVLQVSRQTVETQRTSIREKLSIRSDAELDKFATRARPNLQHEFSLAADVQRHLLNGRLPRVEPFDISAVCQPCKELGGDFYECVKVNGNVALAVGDVSGKGLGASLLMASVRASVRAHLEDLADMRQTMRMVNRNLVHDTRDHEFATLFLGVLDPRTLELTYSSAGHEPAVLVRDGRWKLLDRGGMPIGLDEFEEYEVESVPLHPGDVLAVFTDGLVEAIDPAGSMFGRPRARAAVARESHHDARKICGSLLAEHAWFIGTEPHIDDTTIAVVKVG